MTLTQATTDRRSVVKEVETEVDVHKVQILDPATGTGTFLAEIVKQIYNTFKGQQGIWSNYVENHLIPRLNGFELLMASYAMAHLKLDMLLRETGFKSTKNQRFRIYLTNSLEEHHPDTGTLFATWLSEEANEANHIKRDNPVMVVLGNPPYSGVSSNNGEWIVKLIQDYKYVDGIHFKERKHWLNDDYVKFIRYGQFFIEKNNAGVMAFINPHGYLDNPTFRGMRWNLLKAFDKIYTIDLHGNGIKQEIAPDGSSDTNVFDIMQGVSINIFIKTGEKTAGELAKVFHFDLFGKREAKYKFLLEESLSSINFNLLRPNKPNLFFVPKIDDTFSTYEKGFNVKELFTLNTMGFVSANDSLNISFSKEEVTAKINDLLNMPEADWRVTYSRKKDARDWTYITARNDALKNKGENNIKRVSYRPFDTRFSLYTGNSRGLYSSPQPNITNHILDKDNINFVCVRLGRNSEFHNYFLSKLITDKSIISSLDNANIFPLYIYNNKSSQQALILDDRIPNLNIIIIKRIAKELNIEFISEKTENEKSFAPIDLLDYLYGVLYSPRYREKYKEYLKIDFPRVPYPKDIITFWELVKLGGQLRALHLLESKAVDNYITSYPEDGNNIVTNIRYYTGRVYINEKQYFDTVPEIVWQFYIGGYQPAQKWLKDRKGRELGFDDILHYQRMIVALYETDKFMKEIDKIDFE